MRGEAEPFHTQRAQAPARRGLLDAVPANDVALTVVTLPPRSAGAQRAQAPAPIAARVGPFRTAFRPPWVASFVTDGPPTCGECGACPAEVLVEWPPHYKTIECDGKRYPACDRCWREDRQLFVKAKPAQTAARAAAVRFDERVGEALVRLGSATVLELCIDLELLPEGSERSRENRPATRSMDHALSRLVATGRATKRRRRGAVRFFPRLPGGHRAR